jgi:tetratricopeptide (TPR) repeat protein/DNA-binding beta-propeller fold protein YncE
LLLVHLVSFVFFAAWPQIAVAQTFSMTGRWSAEQSLSREIVSFALSSDGVALLATQDGAFQLRNPDFSPVNAPFIPQGKYAKGKRLTLVAAGPDQTWVLCNPERTALERVEPGKPSVFFGIPDRLADAQAVVVDSGGYVYVLNEKKRCVDVYSPEGQFITWITRDNNAIEKPIALAVNASRELHILDAKGQVHVFNPNGNWIRSHNDLPAKAGFTFAEPKAILTFDDGSFAIAESRSGAIVHFDPYGRKIGTFGSRGSGALGTFKSMDLITATGGSEPVVAVYDREALSNQFFTPDRKIPWPEYREYRPEMMVQPHDLRPITAIAVSPTGVRYVLPADDKTALLAYEGNTNKLVFALTGVFKDAADLATDAAGIVYIADQKAGRIEVYSATGAKITHFGGEGSYKLRKPTGVTVQSNGTVVVCDQDRATLSAWTTQGAFDRELIQATKAGWKDPVRVKCDSKNQLYVLDPTSNTIIRTGISGWPITLQRIAVRGTTPGKAKGKITDFSIDRFDQIHVVNATNGQIEVFTWPDIEPELYFRYGQQAAMPVGFTDVDRLALDTERFRLYLTSAAKKTTYGYDLVVKPPTPEDDYNFFIADGRLVVSFNLLPAAYITGYGLISSAPSGNDSLLLIADDDKFTIDRGTPTPRAKSYRMVSLSRSAQSDPNTGFNDYFSHGMNLLDDGRYDEALPALQSAIDRMGRTKSFREYVARQLAETGEMLAMSGEISRAMPYLRLAHATAPEDVQVVAAYRVGYSAYFKELLNRDDISGIIGESKRLMSSSALSPIVLSSLDSLNNELARQGGEQALSRSVLLRRKMVEWSPANATYRVALGEALLKLYKYKNRAGTTLAETESLLSEAERFISQGVEELKTKRLNTQQAELVHVEVLIAQERFDDAEKQIQNALNAYAGSSKSATNAFKLKLCEVYAARGQHEIAAETYAEIAEAEPNNVAYKALYGRALALANRFEDARQVFQKLLIADRNNAGYTGEIGRIELARGNNLEAAYQLDRALKLDPTRGELHGPLAQALERSANSSDALLHYAAAVRHEELLLAHHQQRLSDKRTLNESKQRLITYLEAEARLNDRLGKPSAARTAYFKLTELAPEQAKFHNALGHSSLAMGLVYDAEKAFYQAVRLEPSNSEFQKSHENALKERARIASKTDPLTVADLRVFEVYPSLYRNYADPRRLPIGELILANNTDGIITPDEITVTIKGLMDEPLRIDPPNLIGFSNTPIPIGAILPEAILENNESRTLQLSIKVTYAHNGQKKKSERTESLTLHARNAIHWGDKRRLASFVAPGVDALMAFNAGIDAGLVNSKEGVLNDALVQALRIYTALEEMQLKYAPDPAYNYSVLSSGTGALDLVQFPAETLIRRQGDCDDFVVLLAGLLENAGVQTAYIDVPGHVFLAINTLLKPHELSAAGISARDVIIDAGEVWVPFETTLIGEADFIAAWKSGIDRYNSEIRRGVYPELVSMAGARKTYAPASYVPNAFIADRPVTAAMTQRYTEGLAALRSQLRIEATLTVESRYQREPGNIYIKNQYAILLARGGELERAEGVLLEALELSPGSPLVLNNLGNVAQLKGDFDAATNYYLEAFENQADDAEICLNLYACYLKAGDKLKADTWLTKAIEIDPTKKSKYGTY